MEQQQQVMVMVMVMVMAISCCDAAMVISCDACGDVVISCCGAGGDDDDDDDDDDGSWSLLFCIYISAFIARMKI
jgi:hypothetical protein